MKKILTLILVAGATLSTRYSEAHPHHRMPMKFPEPVEFEVVEYCEEAVDVEGTATFHGRDLQFHFGEHCSFGGSFGTRKHLNEFRFNDVHRSDGICGGMAGDIQTDLLTIRKKGDGFALRMSAFGSQWVAIGYNNKAAKDVDILILQHFVGNPHSAGEHLEIQENLS